METKDQQTFDFLLSSLNTVENSVKSYDTKSQIVGVGYILAINVVFVIARAIPGQVELNLITVVLAWVVVIFPVLLFGAVLYPTRRSAPKLDERSSSANHVFYVRSEDVTDVTEHLSRVQDSGLKLEMVYEILKISGLRDRKRVRFLRALFAFGVSFFTLFLGQLIRVAGLSPF